MNVISRVAFCMVGVCLICTAACRSSNWQSPEDVAVLQAERRQKVEKSVGLKRSEAELQVARDAWKFGDRGACLKALDGILEREPGHVDALLLKTEVHLAKDELPEADRSIAIALSHAPSNATAKRLLEIVRTKQLAEQPQRPAQAAVEVASAPFPGGEVSQTAYMPSEAGTALAIDDRRSNPPSPQPFGDYAIPVQAEEFAATQAEEPASVQVEQPATAQAEESPFLPAEFPTAPARLEEAVSVVESPLQSTLAQAEPLPTLLTAEEAAAYEISDVDAGAAEVTDQPTSSEGYAENAAEFREALASRNSAAAIAAVESDITNNPNDPQIPLSAAVAALEVNQPETAASISRLGIAFHPGYAGLHRTLGAALYRRGNYASSQVALQQALSLDNTSSLSYFLLGCVSDKLGDTEAAEAYFASADELDPTIADRE